MRSQVKPYLNRYNCSSDPEDGGATHYSGSTARRRCGRNSGGQYFRLNPVNHLTSNYASSGSFTLGTAVVGPASRLYSQPRSPLHSLEERD